MRENDEGWPSKLLFQSVNPRVEVSVVREDCDTPHANVAAVRDKGAPAPRSAPRCDLMEGGLGI